MGMSALKGEASDEIKVSGHKTVRAYNKGEADRGNEQSQLHAERQGDLLLIRTDEPHGSRTLNITTDLDISVPKGMNVETRGRNGDLTIDDVDGSVDVTNGRGDVRLNNIGKDVKVESSRTGTGSRHFDSGRGRSAGQGRRGPDGEDRRRGDDQRGVFRNS